MRLALSGGVGRIISYISHTRICFSANGVILCARTLQELADTMSHKKKQRRRWMKEKNLSHQKWPGNDLRVICFPPFHPLDKHCGISLFPQGRSLANILTLWSSWRAKFNCDKTDTAHRDIPYTRRVRLLGHEGLGGSATSQLASQ